MLASTFGGRRLSGTAQPAAYVMTVSIVLLTTVVAFAASRYVSHASLSLLFLACVLFVSARTSLGPSLLASALSFLALNFFFTRPYHTLKVANEGDVATLVVFLLIAAITGNLAARMRREMTERRASLDRTSKLYEFSRLMASATGVGAVLEALADHLARSLNRGVLILTARDGADPELAVSSGPAVSIDESGLRALWSGTKPNGDPASWRAIKLVTNDEATGMVVFQGDLDEAEQLELARSLCDQASIALGRIELGANLEEARVTAETEQLRSALLSSVSHDLRTPLASIIGSTTSLLEYGDAISSENRRELLSTVVAEARRLDRHIQNLLDMTRLGRGRLSLRRDWVDLHDIVSGALDRLGDRLDLPMDVDIAPEATLLHVHGALVELVLVNVLDNAIRYSPADGRIAVQAARRNGCIGIEVCDRGPGIPEADKARVFDMFYTADPADRETHHGTGLGLAICRAIVAAHGGTISVRDGDDGTGACVEIALPAGSPS